jgi:surface antigen
MRIKRPIVNRLHDLERLAEAQYQRAFQSALQGGDRARAWRASQRWQMLAAKYDAAAMSPVAQYHDS